MLSSSVVGAEGGAEVAGDEAAADQHQIEANVEGREHRMGGEKGFGGADDAPALSRGQRLGPAGARARLDFDDREGPAAPGDEVDLADRRAHVAGDDPIAGEPETPGAASLAHAAEAPGEVAPIPARGRDVHAPAFRATARA